jgi:hypothetical protein
MDPRNTFKVAQMGTTAFALMRTVIIDGPGVLTTGVVVALQDIEKVLEPMLFFFKNRRRPGEALGDFTARVGFDAIRQYSQVCARSMFLNTKSLISHSIWLLSTVKIHLEAFQP